MLFTPQEKVLNLIMIGWGTLINLNAYSPSIKYVDLPKLHTGA